MNDPIINCEICNRPLGNLLIEQHHLIPKELGGKLTVSLHRICHQKIHSTFTNRELLHRYHTIDSIVSHPEIIKFIHWIRNKISSFYLKNDDTSHRKSKRKR